MSQENLIAAKAASWYEQAMRQVMQRKTGPVVVAIVVSDQFGYSVLSGPESNRDYVSSRLQAGLAAVARGEYSKIGEISEYRVEFNKQKIITV